MLDFGRAPEGLFYNEAYRGPSLPFPTRFPPRTELDGVQHDEPPNANVRGSSPLDLCRPARLNVVFEYESQRKN